MWPRTLDPEVMDTAEDAREYDAMDHAAVNTLFVTDFLNAARAHLGQSHVPSVFSGLDLGAGTGLIPIELCRRATNVQVVAVDAAQHMLSAGRTNVAAVGLADRIALIRGDAKQLAFPSGTFS